MHRIIGNGRARPAPPRQRKPRYRVVISVAGEEMETVLTPDTVNPEAALSRAQVLLGMEADSCRRRTGAWPAGSSRVYLGRELLQVYVLTAAGQVVEQARGA